MWLLRLCKPHKNHSLRLFYFKIILHPVSVFLRNYFFYQRPPEKKLFPKKTLQTAHEGFKISQMHRLTFHLAQRPISNLDATRSFVFVLNHRFCLNSASDWSAIFTLSRCLKIPSAFSPMIIKSLSK